MRQVRLHENAKYHSCRQEPQVGPRTIDVSWTVYNYRRPEDVGVIKYLSETNVNDYRHQDHEYLYRRHVPLLPLRTSRERLLPLLGTDREPSRLHTLKL